MIFEWTQANTDELVRLRDEGETFREIAERIGCSESAACNKYTRSSAPADTETGDSILLTRDDISRIASLDDLLAFFKVDQSAWAVRDFRVNKWENYSVENGVTPLYQVRANLVRNVQRDADAARVAYDQALKDMLAASPKHQKLPPPNADMDSPVLYEIAPMDPHIGMLAWGRECGEPYDLSIAVRDYVETVTKAISFASFYNVERMLLVVGNDTIHADTLQGGKIATTTAGTAQDLDTRLPKIYTAARRAIVTVADLAKQVAYLDIIVIPGNHDHLTSYHLAEVLYAWYRLDDRVNVIYSPAKRQGYQYGKNGFLFTHGEEFKRKREPLALIFADEFPELWAASEYREVHCGHFHGTKAQRYDPQEELSETRGVRMRVLSALTPADAWHTEQGYRHHRAVTTMAFHREGGLAGMHEFTPAKVPREEWRG